MVVLIDFINFSNTILSGLSHFCQSATSQGESQYPHKNSNEDAFSLCRIKQASWYFQIKWEYLLYSVVFIYSIPIQKLGVARWKPWAGLEMKFISAFSGCRLILLNSSLSSHTLLSPCLTCSVYYEWITSKAEIETMHRIIRTRSISWTTRFHLISWQKAGDGWIEKVGEGRKDPHFGDYWSHRILWKYVEVAFPLFIKDKYQERCGFLSQVFSSSKKQTTK